MFSSVYSVNKIEGLQERALRFWHGDFDASYELLLAKEEAFTMNVNRLRTLCVKICKTLNRSHPDPEQREKINFKFSFSHFFVVPKNFL